MQRIRGSQYVLIVKNPLHIMIYLFIVTAGQIIMSVMKFGTIQK